MLGRGRFAITEGKMVSSLLQNHISQFYSGKMTKEHIASYLLLFVHKWGQRPMNVGATDPGYPYVPEVIEKVLAERK